MWPHWGQPLMKTVIYTRHHGVLPKDSAAARNDSQHCTDYCNGLIGWLGNMVWNIEEGSGCRAWELEHSNFLLTLREKRGRRRFQIHLERRDFEPISFHFKNTRYWKRTIFICFVFYYYFYSILERGKKMIVSLLQRMWKFLFQPDAVCYSVSSLAAIHKGPFPSLTNIFC